MSQLCSEDQLNNRKRATMASNANSIASYISRASEKRLQEYGDSHQGAGYTRTIEEAWDQYRLMMEVIRPTSVSVSVLDIGCGFAHLLDFIKSDHRFAGVQYTGIDLSNKFLDAARRRHPAADLHHLDILTEEERLNDFDYVILNGIFNYRGLIAFPEMLSYWKRILITAFRHCRIGLAFNAMSKHVDWERDDLFHLPFDEMAGFVKSNLSRHFIIRHDHRGYDYTTYIYRTAWQSFHNAVRHSPTCY